MFCLAREVKQKKTPSASSPHYLLFLKRLTWLSICSSTMYSAGVLAGSLGLTGLHGRSMRTEWTCSLNGAVNCNMSVGTMCAGTDSTQSSVLRSLGSWSSPRQELAVLSSALHCCALSIDRSSSSSSCWEEGVLRAVPVVVSLSLFALLLLLLSRYVSLPDRTPSWGLPVMNSRLTSAAIVPAAHSARPLALELTASSGRSDAERTEVFQ